MTRLNFLDGLRGIAIIFVVTWHAYGPTYSDHLPFGDDFSVIPIRLMWVGVELFFLISGFVILMTLERSAGILHFAFSRWLRLFPAMLISSVLILLFVHTTKLGPHHDQTLADLVPGLTFINPALIHAMTGVSINSMDGPFWSLYVEVCFYLVFGISYFAGGEIVAVSLISLVFFVAVSLWLLFPFPGLSMMSRVSAAFDWIGFIYFGWFASGALYYLFTKKRDMKLFAIATGMAAISAFSGKFFFALSTAEHVALFLVIALFSTALLSRRFQSILSSSFLVFAGSVSYPLYLIHNNMIVGLTSWIGLHSSLRASAPIAPIVLSVCIAWTIAKFAEPSIKAWVRKLVARKLPSDPNSISQYS